MQPETPKKVFILLAYNNTLYRKLEKYTGKNQNHSKSSENPQQEHCTNSNLEPSKISGKFSTLLHSCFDCQKYLQYTSLRSLAVVNKIKNLDYSGTAQKPATSGTASLPLEVCSQNLIVTNALQVRSWYESMKLNRHSYACTKNQYKSIHRNIISTNPKIILKLFQCLPCHPQEQLPQVQEQDVKMQDSNPQGTAKRSSPPSTSKNSKKSRAAVDTSSRKGNSKPKLWFGFSAMEALATDTREEPLALTKLVNKMVRSGYLESEAHELQTAKISFPHIKQEMWPIAKVDKIPRQQYHLTQLPFDVETDEKTGFSLIYNILL